MSDHDLECPRCKSEGHPRGACGLRRRPDKGRGIVVDWCPRCGGIWFDGGELERSFEHAEWTFDDPKASLAGGRTCPEGHGPMSTMIYPHTDQCIDICPECFGVWLERGQFHAIREARASRAAAIEKREREGFRGVVCDWIDQKIADLIGEW